MKSTFHNADSIVLSGLWNGEEGIGWVRCTVSLLKLYCCRGKLTRPEAECVKTVCHDETWVRVLISAVCRYIGKFRGANPDG